MIGLTWSDWGVSKTWSDWIGSKKVDPIQSDQVQSNPIRSSSADPWLEVPNPFVHGTSLRRRIFFLVMWFSSNKRFKGVVVAKWGSRNKFSQFYFYAFLWKYGKLQAFWYSFYFDTWLGKHFLMSSKIFRMKKVEISWFLEI